MITTYFIPIYLLTMQSNRNTLTLYYLYNNLSPLMENVNFRNCRLHLTTIIANLLICCNHDEVLDNPRESFVQQIFAVASHT